MEAEHAARPPARAAPQRRVESAAATQALVAHKEAQLAASLVPDLEALPVEEARPAGHFEAHYEPASGRVLLHEPALPLPMDLAQHINPQESAAILRKLPRPAAGASFDVGYLSERVPTDALQIIERDLAQRPRANSPFP